MHSLFENMEGVLDIAPATDVGTGPTVGAYKNAGNYSRLVWIVAVGASTAATATIKLRQASDSSGTGAADVTGAALTAATFGIGANDDSYAVIDADPAKIAVLDATKPWVAISVARVGGTELPLAAFFLGTARHRPPTENAVETVELAGGDFV